MGGAFTEPVTSKETLKVENDRFICGSSSMQGWRPSILHKHVLVCDIR